MEKTGFQNLVDKLSSVATLDSWEPLYNRQLDFFYWKKPKLSKNTKLIKVSHEAYLYITPKGKIEGIFVEYLNNNFVEHNTDYKQMVRIFNKKTNDDEYTISKKNKDMVNLFDKFAESLRADIYRDAISDKKTIADLNFAISTSLAA